MIPSEDLDRRFAYHQPNTNVTVEKHETVRNTCREFAEYLNSILPDGREKSLAVTSLEEVMFWSNAAIAREGK